MFIIFDCFVNFVFCVRLLYELKYEPFDEHKIKTIKVLLQFLAKSFDNSAFEYYSLNNEDYLWAVYETIKKKNSTIFQLIVLLHSFLFNHLIYQIAYTIFGYGWIDKYFTRLNKKLDKQIQNNFGYHYLVEYRKYYNDDIDFYKHIRYKVFFWESLINITCWWNNICIKYHWPKFVINNDNLFYKAENYF